MTSAKPDTTSDSELKMVKELLFGAYLRTLDMVHLDGENEGFVEKGADPETAFETQWEYIQPHLQAYIAERERQLLTELLGLSKWYDLSSLSEVQGGDISGVEAIPVSVIEAKLQQKGKV